MADAGVEKTNDDATECKCSAVKLGYYKDRFVDLFWRKQVHRKPPILNRGYFARAHAVYLTSQWFVKHVNAAGLSPQIVNLGGGFDTLYWRLLDEELAPSGGFFDVDMPAVVAKKQGVVQRHPDKLKTQGPDGNAHYKLFTADLRKPEDVMRGLESQGFDTSRPTLFVAECVLVYLEAEESAALLSTLAAAVTEACFINYEMINPDDPFGRVMVRNLELRGCPLRGLNGCPDLKSQEARFDNAGWHSRPAKDMNAVFKLLPAEDVARVRKLEIFDEIEEWELISAHYCISTAFKDSQNLGLDAMPF
eukprot:m.92441 g.92441  ORF g.92441 m.92441 type:complete len:306 (+) comp9959_c0_seq1:108-1025(+)